jgi:hypothetical protein
MYIFLLYQQIFEALKNQLLPSLNVFHAFSFLGPITEAFPRLPEAPARPRREAGAPYVPAKSGVSGRSRTGGRGPFPMPDVEIGTDGGLRPGTEKLIPEYL